jgi:terminase large subunit-like protein
VRLESGYQPYKNPRQVAFHKSKAKIRGYGGAMGGGKSRAMCEEVFDLSLNHPGLKTIICRQAHTSIIETTKKTMMEQVLPPQLVVAKKESMGEDWVKIRSSGEEVSTIHFAGLDDPVRWFSGEYGLLAFDEAHEISEDAVVKLNTRLRQRCPECTRQGREECDHYPYKIMVGFNPENPGHWLQSWFILGGSPTEFGYYKRELYPTGAESPIGDCEFIFAKPTDNPFLSKRYIREQLGGLPEFLRRRYMEGEWLYVTGSCFFDVEALTDYQKRACRPVIVGKTVGDLDREPKPEAQRIRIVNDRAGGWSIWKPPVRRRKVASSKNEDRLLELPGHRYLATVDTSSGGSTDYSAIQVLDVDAFEQVAEYQGMLDPDLLAVEAYRIGRIYNNALVAPEITGGWGFTIAKELQRLRYPRLYTRVVEDRLSRQWTDKVGWDTSTKTRMVMLDTLERVLREREFELYSEKALAELLTFVWNDERKPAAQPGCNDDLVVTLAMGVTIAASLPRQLRDEPLEEEDEYVPQYAATGF